MDNKRDNEKFNSNKILNKPHIEEIIQVVKSNMPFTKYFNTYVDDKVNLNLNNKCICPMHEESEPSFRYFSETDTFACFGKCHVAGNVIKFHESYLKFLIKTGQVIKYKSITNLNPNNINYYTSLQDLVNIMKLQVHSVYIDTTIEIKHDSEVMYSYFNNKNDNLKLAVNDLTTNAIEDFIIKTLILNKNNSNYASLYKEYTSILTMNYDALTIKDKLIEIYRELNNNTGGLNLAR